MKIYIIVLIDDLFIAENAKNSNESGSLRSIKLRLRLKPQTIDQKTTNL